VKFRVNFHTVTTCHEHVGAEYSPSVFSDRIIVPITNKKFELMLTRRAKAYSSSGSVV